MNQQSYEVNSRKGAVNVNDAYDFKNVQVGTIIEILSFSIKISILSIVKTTTFVILKQRCNRFKSSPGYSSNAWNCPIKTWYCHEI